MVRPLRRLRPQILRTGLDSSTGSRPMHGWSDRLRLVLTDAGQGDETTTGALAQEVTVRLSPVCAGSNHELWDTARGRPPRAVVHSGLRPLKRCLQNDPLSQTMGH